MTTTFRFSKSKMVYADEWVRVRNLMNSRFRAGRPCSICRTFKCVPVWYSIKTGEVRCLRCFDAESAHQELRGWR